MKVAIFMGSESDFDIIKAAVETLKAFDVPFAVEVTSAHRSPEKTVKLVKSLEDEGAEVFIAVAGKAAHLAGLVAAHTLKPVIGVPVGGTALGGLDALLSTVQMPKGVPVACMGIGESGAVNASLLAVQILSLKDASLADKIKEGRKEMALKVEESSKKIQEKL